MNSHGAAFGNGGHRSCGVLVGVFWCVVAPGSGEGESKYTAGHKKRDTKEPLGLSHGCSICSWVAARGDLEGWCGSSGWKGVPLGCWPVSPGLVEGQGQHTWLK